MTEEVCPRCTAPVAKAEAPSEPELESGRDDDGVRLDEKEAPSEPAGWVPDLDAAAEALFDMLHLYSGYNVLSRGPIGLIHKCLREIHPAAQKMLSGGAEVSEVRDRFWPTDENGDPVEPAPQPPATAGGADNSGIDHWLTRSWRHHERSRQLRGIVDGSQLTHDDHAFIELWHAVRVLGELERKRP